MKGRIVARAAVAAEPGCSVDGPGQWDVASQPRCMLHHQLAHQGHAVVGSETAADEGAEHERCGAQGDAHHRPHHSTDEHALHPSPLVVGEVHLVGVVDAEVDEGNDTKGWEQHSTNERTDARHQQ